MITKLSKQQKLTLIAIFDMRKDMGHVGISGWNGKFTDRQEVRRKITAYYPSRSQSASFSRTLRRLEQRGLIELRTWCAFSDMIKLTERGERIAKNLNVQTVNITRV